MTTIATATPGANRVPKTLGTGYLAAGWFTTAALLTDLGLTGLAAGSLLFASGASTLSKLPIGPSGQLLVAGASAPAWSGTGLSYASGALAHIGGGGVTSRQAASQDGVQLLGRAGGTSGWLAQITTAALTANRTASLPDASMMIAGSASALTLTRIPYGAGSGLLKDADWLVTDEANQKLTIGNGSSAAQAEINVQRTAGQNGLIGFRTGSSQRWRFILNGTESGSDAGGTLGLQAYSDAGAFLDTPLSITRAAAGAITLSRPTYVSGAAATQRVLGLMTAGVNRAWIYLTSTAESGADAGSNLAIAMYGDGGSFIDTPLTIARAAGSAITLARPVTISGSNTLTVGGLTPGRILFASTGGLLTDSATLTYSASGGGGLVAANASSSFFISVSGAASFAKGFVFSTGGVGRWIFQSDATAETGSDAGSPFSLYARTDAGAAIDVPLNIVRAAGGAITLARPVICSIATGAGLTVNSTTDATTTSDGGFRLLGGLSAAKNIVYGGYLKQFNAGTGDIIQVSTGFTTTTTIGAKDQRLLFRMDSATANAGAEIVWAATSDTNVERWAAISGGLSSNSGSGATGYLSFCTKTADADTALVERLRIAADGLLTVQGNSIFGGSITSVTNVCVRTGASIQQTFTSRNEQAPAAGVGTYFQFAGEAAGTAMGAIVSKWDAAANTDASLEFWTRSAGTQAVRMTLSSAGLLTLTNQIKVPDGSASAPGIRLTGEQSGLYRVAIDALGLTVNGVLSGYMSSPSAGNYGGGIFLSAPSTDPVWYGGTSVQSFQIFGGIRSATTAAGAQVRVYSTGHATKADYIEFTRGNTVVGAFDGAGNFTASANLTASAQFRATSATGGIGYGAGAGGTVTQATSRTTGVTIATMTGAITLVSAAGSATWQSFTVTNSNVVATDTIIVNQVSGTDLYIIQVTNVGAGSFRISFATTGGTTTEQPVFRFTILKSVST